MKIGFWVQLVFIFLEVSVFLTPVECFTIPISVSTGLAIIMALVKVKAVIVKVLLGLKAMGYETLVWRTSRKRRSAVTALPVPMSFSESVLFQDELVTAWNDLQQTVGKVIQFDLESCLGAAGPRSRAEQIRPVLPWDHLEENFDHRATRNKEYFSWVSKVLGASIKDPLGCHILDEELHKSRPVKELNGKQS